jgi:hypothetical protein
MFWKEAGARGSVREGSQVRGGLWCCDSPSENVQLGAGLMRGRSDVEITIGFQMVDILLLNCRLASWKCVRE